MVNPVLKWAGGKKQLLNELYAHFPQNFKRYHEPMVGGGALLFDLEPKEGTINDINGRLINFYKQIRDNPEELIEICGSFKHPETKTDPSREFNQTDRKGKKIRNYYYQQREIFNRSTNGEEFDPLEEAALFLYLNRTCYNGLYRENLSGGFNVPIGRYKNPDWVRKDLIRNAMSVLKSVEIFNKDFGYIIDSVKSGDLVYFDPPYEPMSTTADFTSYNAGGFDKNEQKNLLKLIQQLDKKGVYVLVSNSGVMFEMYNECGFFVDIVSATRAINSNPNKRGEVNEIIASNIPPKII
ncbi:MAG: DNA adenine methylase [Promethearchaeota archaeon]